MLIRNRTQPTKAQALAEGSDEEIAAFLLACREDHCCQCEHGHHRCSDDDGGPCADELLAILGEDW
jgi:hypothetical protein